MSNKMSKNLAYGFAASQMGFLVVAGLLGGLWIDKKFGTTPLWGMVGLIGGFASGIRLLILLVRSQDDGTKKDS